jgi:hypothetical protein
MAAYTHKTLPRGATAGRRYKHSKDTSDGTFKRAALSLISRLRPGTAASKNAKLIFGPDYPNRGSSFKTGFTPVSGTVTRDYPGGHKAIGSKLRTRV